MYDEKFKNYILSIKNATTKKMNSTEIYRRLTLDFYQLTLISKMHKNRKLVQKIAQFLQYVYYHKRIGVKKVNQYIEDLEGIYYAN